MENGAFILGKNAINLESCYKFKFNHKKENMTNQKNLNNSFMNMENFQKTLDSQKIPFSKEKNKKKFLVLKKKDLQVINESILYKNISYNNENHTMQNINKCIVHILFQSFIFLSFKT